MDDEEKGDDGRGGAGEETKERVDSPRTSYGYQRWPLPIPPLLFLLLLVVGLYLQREYFGGLQPVQEGVHRPIALAISLLAGGFAISAIVTLRDNNTPASLKRPTTTFVVQGPYRYSRNPMYLALVLVLLAAAILFLSLGLLSAAVGLWIVLDRGVVDPEERYLKDRFGEEYRRYREEVRRWI